ncbi:MAG: hypothetical protein COB10_07665 [Planctomycetota bacterium]|nr:MAG: hypothetical protein COB10_07665 [Planctomycetota bacterium]
MPIDGVPDDKFGAIGHIEMCCCWHEDIHMTSIPSRKQTSDRKITVAALGSRLKAGVPAVIAIVGKEELLRREAVETLLDCFPGGDPGPDGVVRIHGDKVPDEHQLRSLFDEIRTPNLFGAGPVVILSEAQNWLKVDPDSWCELISAPMPGSMLILTLNSLDGRSKVSKKIIAHGLHVCADRPFHRPPPWQPDARPWEHEMNSWVVNRFRKKKLEATPQVGQLLIDRVGPQMDQLAATIEKISTICDSRDITRIEDEIIIENSAPGGDGSTFELVDSWFEKDRARALEVLWDILERGSLDEKDQRVKNPQRLLLQFMALALKRAREIRAVHSIVARGGGQKEVMEQAGIARPFLPRIRKQYRSCDPERTRRVIETLIEMDWQLKTGAGPRPEELIERALMSV